MEAVRDTHLDQRVRRLRGSLAEFLVRVPRRFERPHWYACGRILRADLVDERVYDIRNWNINLSNGDIA